MFLQGVGYDPSAYGSKNGTEGASASGTSAGGGISGATEAELGRNDFLQLLVSQLENQDPLKPAEDTEFVAQLATFSSLEQLIDMNSRMDAVISGQKELANAQAMELVGREVLIDTTGGFQLEGGRSESLVFDLEQRPETGRVDIYDDGGSLVRSMELESLRSGRHQVRWDGLNEDGEEMPSGSYRAEVVLGNGEEETSTVVPFVSMSVDGLHVGPNGIALSSDTRTVGLNQVLEIRAKSDS